MEIMKLSVTQYCFISFHRRSLFSKLASWIDQFFPINISEERMFLDLINCQTIIWFELQYLYHIKYFMYLFIQAMVSMHKLNGHLTLTNKCLAVSVRSSGMLMKE